MKNVQKNLNLLFPHTFFMMFTLFQKYLNPQVRTQKSVTTPYPCPPISLNDTSFHISLSSLGFYLSPECSLNFL